MSYLEECVFLFLRFSSERQLSHRSFKMTRIDTLQTCKVAKYYSLEPTRGWSLWTLGGNHQLTHFLGTTAWVRTERWMLWGMPFDWKWNQYASVQPAYNQGGEVLRKYFIDILTLLITANFATELKMVNQIPMSWALWATGLLQSFTILSESILISKILLARAKNGAKGKAATKIVMKPNWITEGKGITC